MIIWVNSESARPVYGFYEAVISIKEIHIQFILQELLSGELIFLLQFIVCVGEKCSESNQWTSRRSASDNTHLPRV